MKNIKNLFLLLQAIVLVLSLSCNSESKTKAETETEPAIEEIDDNAVTLIEASAIEGEIYLIFKDKSGNELIFIEYYENEVISKYDFISSDDGHSPNPEYMNKKFRIEYVEEEGDILDKETGDYVTGMVKKLKKIELIK